MRDGGNYTKTLLEKLKKERENVKRSRKTEEEKTNPSTLKFLRHVVLAFKKHAMTNCNVVKASAIVHSKGRQADNLGKTDQTVLKMLRYDILDYLVRMTKVKVVYKKCQKPSFGCICRKEFWYAQ
jgi:hypothetical protein